MNRLPGLDLLRAIAIVWVMLFHARIAGLGSPVPQAARFGWMGVDLFYVLSGFLIGSQLLEAAHRGEPIRFVDFYRRRAFRILPAYWVVVAVYFLWPSLRETSVIQPLWQFLSFTENLFIRISGGRAFSHVWSLCVEEHFYLMFPLILWLMLRSPSAGRTIALAICVVFAGMAWRAHVWYSELVPLKGDEDQLWQRFYEDIYYPTYTRLDGLLMGVLLAAARTYRPQWWGALMQKHRWLLAGGAAGLAASIALFQQWLDPVTVVIGYPLLSLSLAAMVAALASPHGWLGSRRLPGAGAIAAMAYSLYLSHKLALHAVRVEWGTQLQTRGMLAFFVYAGAVFAAGAALYWLVERPMLRLRDRRPSAMPGIGPLATGTGLR